MRSHDSVVLSYLLGSQASRNFEAVSSLELSELLEDAGLDGGVDVLLTAIAVKIRQVEEGLLHIGQLKDYFDEVAEAQSGLLEVDRTDEGLAAEIQMMNRRLYAPEQEMPQAA